MRELPVPTVHVHSKDYWLDYEDLAQKLKKHSGDLFPA